MSKNKITTLLVVPNTLNYDPQNEFQTYVLIHPLYTHETNQPLWGHLSSSLTWACKDLQYPNHRKEFLDELFGEYQWQFETYIITDFKEATRYFKSVNRKNPQFSIECITELLAEYKAEGKNL